MVSDLPKPEPRPHPVQRPGLKVGGIPKVILKIESSRASGRALLHGIAEYSHQRGPWAFSWEASGLAERWLQTKCSGADGIILRDTTKLREVLSFGLPVVVIGHLQQEIAGAVNVSTDSQAIGRLGAEHLLRCGFRNFAFCGFTVADGAQWPDIRRKHFANCVEQAGFAAPATFDFSIDRWEKERAAGIQWLASLPKPVGLMACNDDCGQRVMELCKSIGLAVPDEVGVIGADNDEVVCNLMDPPMSSIAVNFERAGYEAAAALDRLMRGDTQVPSCVTAVATHIAARRSTDFVASDNPHLHKALVFIRDHARKPLVVRDVARASGLSRRSLELNFSRFLGRTILQEIRRARTDQIARLLVESDTAVAKIAEILGFPDAQHVARYFRAGKKISPTTYRKTYGHAKLGPLPKASFAKSPAP
jgi:LacI family transcriptional regulator